MDVDPPYGDAAAAYQAWIDQLWNGPLDDLEDVASGLVARDFVGSWPGAPEMVRGAAALAGVVRAGRLPFDGLRFEIEVGPITSGDLVAARWVGRGRYAGGERALPGATAPAGTPVEFRGHDILRFAGGAFSEYWVISEGEHLMSQLTV
ncbi:SnoaL-like protein [Haloactinopolyspora alba]|uniref:SnoaL-like protein n=1 Tax=Haloactinopolyspora alba TaxID=648780 RepID=A0A2P8DVF4_9ACTN|nr:nuclear transport factor 2 family protein [Haloactinopolyspora alba]PSL01157.1 SnoaL-like protein [Haloactinopolyspora alba]